MKTLIKNIGRLFQVYEQVPSFKKGKEMNDIPCLEHAFVIIQDGKIASFGKMKELEDENFDEIIDASHRMVLPAYIDCHTHLVFPETREQEFEMKIKGATYEEIAAAGGGILNSAQKLKSVSEDELFERSFKRLGQIIKLGTGAVEIKSGYGLDTEGELKMLRVIQRIKENSPIPVKSTFLGAHAVPKAFKNDRAGYIRMIIDEMLPEIISNKLAEYIDIFIEKGFFDPDDAARILEKAIAAGLKPRLHVDQLNSIGGVEIARRFGAISVDHLENSTDESLELLAQSSIVPVVLPSCSFYLNMKYAPARKMIDKGLGLAIASDFNPGSSPSGNLNFSISLACIKMKMLPTEAINAVTVNAAYALEMQDSLGAIFPGALANLIMTEPGHNLSLIPYSFGRPVIEQVLIYGERFNNKILNKN